MSGFIASDGSALVGALNSSSIGQALQVDGAGNLKVTQGGGGVAPVLNQASAPQTTSGNSADLAVGQFSELTIDCNITAISGTNPTLQIFLERKGADGVYYPIWQSVTITSAPAQVSTSVGAGMSIAQGFGSIARLRWVIGGTSPSFTVSTSIIGK
jgi:hypothetical protein